MQVETAKKTLILHGTKTSGVLNSLLSEIYHLKKDNSVKFSRKNDNIRPFESGGETSLEFFSLKTDCSLLVVCSHHTQHVFATPFCFNWFFFLLLLFEWLTKFYDVNFFFPKIDSELWAGIFWFKRHSLRLVLVCRLDGTVHKLFAMVCAWAGLIENIVAHLCYYVCLFA